MYRLMLLFALLFVLLPTMAGMAGMGFAMRTVTPDWTVTLLGQTGTLNPAAPLGTLGVMALEAALCWLLRPLVEDAKDHPDTRLFLVAGMALLPASFFVGGLLGGAV